MKTINEYLFSKKSDLDKLRSGSYPDEISAKDMILIPIHDDYIQELRKLGVYLVPGDDDSWWILQKPEDLEKWFVKLPKEIQKRMSYNSTQILWGKTYKEVKDMILKKSIYVIWNWVRSCHINIK